MTPTTTEPSSNYTQQTDEIPTRRHAIERTSPKGERFIGTCWQCGRTGLTMADAFEACENIAHLTETESLLMAVEASPGAKEPWPDPTLEMLEDPIFNAIWHTIKTWDINVPTQYAGYCGATGNHARAIFDAIRPAGSLDDYPLFVRLRMLAKAAEAMENGYLAKTLREASDFIKAFADDVHPIPPSHGKGDA